MKRLLALVCFFSLSNLTFSQKNENTVNQVTINFDNNHFIIKPAETRKIDLALQNLPQDFSNYAIEISAYTDNNGSEEFNKMLSYNRAKAVADYIVKKGFAPQTISFVAQGESNPIADNASELGRAENRRASFKIIENKDVKNTVAGFTIKEELFPVDSQKPGIIKYSSGTEITIPENAFIDKDGNPVSGTVEVNYIEYRDPVDFILGNIPMDYKQNGKNFFFNSAGMFKIGATKNNEEVFLNPDKPISIDFKLVDNLPDVNFYKFDVKKNEWTKDTLNVLNSKTANLDTFLDFQMEEEDSTDVLSSKPSKNNLKNNVVDGNFNCAAAFYNLKLGKALITSTDTLYNKTLLLPLKFKPNNLKRQKTIEFQRTNNEKTKRNLLAERSSYLMKCGVTTEKVDGKNTLKVNVFSDSYVKRLAEINWIASDTETNSLKSGTLVSIQKKSKNLYAIVIKDSINEKKLDNLSIDKLNPQKEIMLDNIITQVKNRKTQLNRLDNLTASQEKIIQNKNKLIKNLKKVTYTTEDSVGRYRRLLDRFWEFNKEFMAKEEKTLNRNEWIKYFDAHKTVMAGRYKGIEAKKEFQQCFAIARESEKAAANQRKINLADNSLRQKLNISSLGIYNCDQIQRLQEPLIVNVEYEDTKGEKIIPVYIYIVDKKINGLLRYDGYNGYSPFHFAYSPSSESTLLAFDANGNAYIYSAQKMKDLRKRSSPQMLSMNKIENIDNKDQLASLLN